MNRVQEQKVRQMVKRILKEDHLNSREEQLQYIIDNLDLMSDEKVTEIYSLMEQVNESKQRRQMSRRVRLRRR